MKVIQCEMCGGNNLVKENGYFVCQSCGTKYAPEEAKKLMVEGRVDVSGSTVKIDNTDSLENYMTLATSAYNSKNYLEAEQYCNRIIEITPNSVEAWLLKGRSAWSQSTGGNIRIDESTTCFINAIAYASDADRNKVLSLVRDYQLESTNNIVAFASGLFRDLATADGRNRVINVVNTVNRSWIKLSERGVQSPDEKVSNSYALIITNDALYCWNNKVAPDFKSHGMHPSEFDYSRFIEQSGYVKDLLLFAISVAPKDYGNNINRYNSLITITNSELSSGPEKYSAEQKGWITIQALDANAVQTRRNQIKQWQQAITAMNPNAKVVQTSNVRTPGEQSAGIAVLTLGLFLHTVAMILCFLSFLGNKYATYGFIVEGVVMLGTLVYVFGDKDKKRSKGFIVFSIICIFICMFIFSKCQRS